MLETGQFFVYIVTNANHTTLYTGFTNDLSRRIWEHKNRIYKYSFTSKYNCDKLIYFEEFQNSEDALNREKQLKKYRRKWKEQLINDFNQSWRDLYEDVRYE